MSPILAGFLKCAAAPAAAVAAGVFATGTIQEPVKSRLHALMIAAGFMVGSYLLLGRLSFPPADASEAIPYTALICAVFVAAFPQVQQAPYLIRAMFVAGMMAVVLWHLGPHFKWHIQDPYTRNTLAFFCLALGVWSIVERNVYRVNMLSIIGLPLIAASTLSLFLLFGASASWSQMAGILCAILGGQMVIAALWPGKIGKAAIVPFTSVFIILMMTAGHFYLDINPWKMVILCIPFVFIWTRSWYGFIPNNPIVEFIILAIMALLPLGWFTWDAFKSAGPIY